VRKAVDRIQVGRIRQGDGQVVAMAEDGHNAVALGDVAAHGGNQFVIQADITESDHLHAEMSGLGLGKDGAGDNFLIQHQVYHA
jgi:hypothetical protein